MGYDKRNQGESMNTIYIPKAPDDRRWYAWCKYYVEDKDSIRGKCVCPKNKYYYGNHCPGSQFCEYYKEDRGKTPPGGDPPPPPKPTIFKVGSRVWVRHFGNGQITEMEYKINVRDYIATVKNDDGEIKKIPLNRHIKNGDIDLIE